VNSSLLREMWRAAASLECCRSVQTELGRRSSPESARETRGKRVLVLPPGSGELFYGPMNQVLPPATARAGWKGCCAGCAARAFEAIASIARRTGQAAPTAWRDAGAGAAATGRADRSERV